MNFYSLWNCIFYNAGSSITRDAFCYGTPNPTKLCYNVGVAYTHLGKRSCKRSKKRCKNVLANVPVNVHSPIIQQFRHAGPPPFMRTPKVHQHVVNNMDAAIDFAESVLTGVLEELANGVPNSSR